MQQASYQIKKLERYAISHRNYDVTQVHSSTQTIDQMIKMQVERPGTESWP